MFYNGLTSLDGSLTPRPSLAEEFSSKDARTWVFKLRKGVTFHDGKALTPADVVFSIMRHKDPATGSKAKVLAEQIEEVKATGPNEVTVRLAAPNADLPAILGTWQDRIKGSPRHAIFETRGGLYTDLIMRRDSTPGNNPDFVLAMKHLFNREQTPTRPSGACRRPTWAALPSPSWCRRRPPTRRKWPWCCSTPPSRSA